MSCVCQRCKNKYKVDIIIPNFLWQKIKPQDKSKEAGLLCGRCIFDRIELLNEYASYNLKRNEKEN